MPILFGGKNKKLLPLPPKKNNFLLCNSPVYSLHPIVWKNDLLGI
jgi:hypothetical protein